MANLFLPVSIVMGVISFSLVARWYVMPALRDLPRSAALTPLLLLHTTRYAGLAFLIPGVTAEALDPRFANPAAYGDLLAALLALVAVAALRLRMAAAIPLVWLFNVAGFLDLLNALFQGFRHTHGGQLGAAYFIPAVIVPALLVSHVLVFILLVAPQRSAEHATPDAAAA